MVIYLESVKFVRSFTEAFIESCFEEYGIELDYDIAQEFVLDNWDALIEMYNKTYDQVMERETKKENFKLVEPKGEKE